MEVLEKIVIVEFNSISEALDYMKESGNSFAFKVTDDIYSDSGDIILIESEYTSVLINEIWLGDISNKSLPGVLYVEDGFLKYYKEVNI